MSGIVTQIENAVFKDGIAQEDNSFSLTPEQEYAVMAVMNWYESRNSPVWKRDFVLAGAAGTGKSSIIQYIIKNLGLSEFDVLCSAFTGKATLNLYRKGNRSHTLHSSIYDAHFDGTNKPPVFTRKPSIPYKLIIVDEASMISEEMYNDIMSFGVPAIFIGDHCQLPPVNDSFNIMKEPDYTLKTILRQAAKSPIIRASQLAIKGQIIPYCNFQGFRKIRYSELKDEDYLWADQIIVGTNAMRHKINKYVRNLREFKTPIPQAGERMIGLRNNPRLGICNGQIIYLSSDAYYNDTDNSFFAEWRDELEMIDPLIACASKGDSSFYFKLKDPKLEDPNVKINDYAYLDYGYAISCHKSQGSGWEKVLVFDEGFGFEEDTRRRWLYTAITRAKKQILIVKK